MISRRGLLGMFAAGAAAIIRTPGLLMPVKPIWVPFSTDNSTVMCYERLPTLAEFRKIMTPGLLKIKADCLKIPSQWETVFANA